MADSHSNPLVRLSPIDDGATFEMTVLNLSSLNRVLNVASHNVKLLEARACIEG